jgi:multiple sugar transport system ATP-binding protein
MADVRFENVQKRFGKNLVIPDLSLEIRDQEFMVLVGPSGCGKTTALRMIAGLEEVSDGKVSIGDRVVNDLPPKERDIAMVFQSYALYPHMSIRENMDFGLRLRKMPPDTIKKLVDEASEILGIGHLLDRKPKQLSGGQRQRVAVGRAIVRKPSVFLFDEPLSNLDAKLRVQMRAEISKLQSRLKTTTVYVTHDQVEAMTMGHRISVMKDGKLQQVGTPLDLYDTPANLFVANFIGTPPMNMVAATVAESGAKLESAKFFIPVPQRHRAAAASRNGAKVVWGLRPEHILGPGAEPRGDSWKLPLEVEVLEPLGYEVIVHGRIGDERLVFKVDPHLSPKVGDTMDVHLELDRLHLFDAESELRFGE